MIKSFKHKGLQRFFVAGDTRGLTAAHIPRLTRLLDALDQAERVSDLDVPGWFLHRLKGQLKDLHSLRVSGNWRVTFEFIDGDAHIVNLEDYH
jgi:toxin HigB-1